MGFEGYRGNVPRDKWSELLVELTVIGVSLMLFGIQVGCWVTLALVGWRLLNLGKDVI